MKNLRARWRRWKRARRRRHAAEEFRNVPLREFVYLDDVSVYSLISSRLGAVAAEFSESESASLVSEISSAGGASAGVLKGEIGSRAETSKSYGSQVVRKSIIQSQFKELVDIEHDRMVIQDSNDRDEFPKIASDQELIALLEKDRSDGLIIAPSMLRRGELIEIEVELDAEAIFRLNAILSTLLDLLKENPELLGAGGVEGIQEVETVRRILDRLSVGLVPLKGRAVGYKSLRWKDADYLVDERLVGQLTNSKFAFNPVYVVGVAEAGLFWRDIRRVLFSGSRYLIMCRIGRSELQEDWTPLKLLDVLKDVVPGLPDLLGNGGEGLLEMLKSGAHNASNQDERQLMRSALVDYAQTLASRHDESISENDLRTAGLLSDQQLDSYEPIQERRSAFEKVTRYLEDRLGIEKIDPEQAADDRASVIQRSETLVVASTPKQTFDVEVADPAQRFLDTEIVAIYW